MFCREWEGGFVCVRVLNRGGEGAGGGGEGAFQALHYVNSVYVVH